MYYGPSHTYRFEVRGLSSAFFTDDPAEAIEEALLRSSYTKRTIVLVDNDENTVARYRCGYQIL